MSLQYAGMAVGSLLYRTAEVSTNSCLLLLLLHARANSDAPASYTNISV
jgi:hypothetical protein